MSKIIQTLFIATFSILLFSCQESENKSVTKINELVEDNYVIDYVEASLNTQTYITSGEFNLHRDKILSLNKEYSNIDYCNLNSKALNKYLDLSVYFTLKCYQKTSLDLVKQNASSYLKLNSKEKKEIENTIMNKHKFKNPFDSAHQRLSNVKN